MTVLPVSNFVTILILVDGFLQYGETVKLLRNNTGHNPYFSRWFSAMYSFSTPSKSTHSHNPYFSRWFSAM